jgi:peptide/nickel transport system substrate-binding protein
MKYRITLLLVLVAVLALPFNNWTAAQEGKQYGESPMLTERVNAGELPPVADRLPENPRVIEFPGSGIGTYGGEVRIPFGGDSPFWGGQMVFWSAWRGLVKWNADFSNWEPNIAESVDVSDDASQFTFHLRQGIKWSDGEPFTADDILFYIDDILKNEEINGGTFPTGFLTPDGSTPPSVEKSDDYTVKFTFNVPYGMFLLNMCNWDGWQMVAAPKHYLQQFHDKYNHDGIPDLLKENPSASDWVSLFQQKSAVGPGADQAEIMRDVNYPTLFPWVVTQPLGTGTQFIAERNPYYYWVDAEGNQLPYIDRLVETSYQDQETMKLDVLAGKFDYMGGPNDEDLPLFIDNEATSGLTVHTLPREGGNVGTIIFNITNPTLGDIFSQQDFRIGMSYAINRQEIVDIVYYGEVTPRQIAPTEDSPLYNDQLATQYLDYNVDLANQYLDKVLPDKDSDGWRLKPDGEKLSIVFSLLSNDYGGRYADVTELLKGYYAAVGVDIVIDVVDNQVVSDRGRDNSLEATIGTGEGGMGITAILDARNYVPNHGQAYWGNGWALWYLTPDNPDKVEPPQIIKDQLTLMEQVRQAPTSEQRDTLMKQLLQVDADNFWVMGIASSPDTFRPVSSKLANVPEHWVDGWNPGGIAIAFPEQWYFAE